MTMPVVIIQLLIFASLILSVYMIVVTLEQCRSEKRYGFVYCMVTIFLYTLGYFVEINSGETGGAVVAIKIMYSGGCFMSPFFFLFVADYCEIRIPKKYYTIPILIIPVLFYGIVLTFDKHRLLYLDYYYNAAKTIPGMTVEPGPLYLVGTFYPLLCIILTCVVLVRAITRQGRGWRLALILLLVSCLGPLIANFSYVVVSFFFKSALAGINFTAFVMVASNFIFYYNVIRNDLFDFAPKAHAITMDLIRDAFVVLDRDMAYTGSNKRAQELFPALTELHKGSSILSLESWPDELIYAEEKDTLKKEIEFTLPHCPGMIFSGWTNRIDSDSGALLGWVIIIQDITETVRLINNIRSQRDEIAVMRDNLKEGIFLMDREYWIQASYSKALEEVLSATNLQGRCFTDLLRNSFSSKDVGIIADYFTMIIDKTVDDEMLEDMNPLAEFSYTSAETGEVKTLRCLFAPVEQGDGEVFVMGTIQDISAETLLKKQLAGEEERRQDEMRYVFEMMRVDQKVFGDFIEDADHEFGRMDLMLGDKRQSAKKQSGRELLTAVFQSVHAIKSNALLAGMSSYGGKLHGLESKIKTLRDKGAEPHPDEIRNIRGELETLKREKTKLIELLDRIKNFGAQGAAKKDDEVFVAALRQACEKTAADENKKITFTVKHIDKDALARGPRRIIKDILVQLARNAAHHGIETPEERRASGKDEHGNVTLTIAVEDNAARITLEDDGRGLDFSGIARRAEALGLLAKNDPRKTDRQFLSALIFGPGFSTSRTEGLHGGRGIGLNLVRDRLREVHGKISLSSKQGRGLAFDIQIPLKQE